MNYRNPGRGFFDRISSFSAVSWLIIINAIISLSAFIFFVWLPGFIDYIALKPENILQGKFLWSIILHMFVHGSFFHLFINMFVLYSLGGLSERIIGRKRFVWFYIISGIFAGMLSVLLAGLFGFGLLEKIFGAPNVYMVGASGAIFAIAGLFVVLLPKIRFSIIFLPFFSLPAYIMVPLVLFATWAASVAAGLPIGNVAHFGGFLAGLVYGFYLRAKYRKKVMLLQRYFR